MRLSRGGSFATLTSILMMSGCALIAGVSDYTVVDDAGDGGEAANPANGDASRDGSGTDGSVNRDDASSSGGDAGDGAPPTPPFCNPADPELVLCFRFEGNVNDEGAGAASTATTLNVSFVPGAVGQGAHFTAASSFVIAPSAKIDAIKIFTLEAFVTLEALPATGGRAGVIDSDNRFGLFVLHNGFTCTNTQAVPIVTTVPLVLSTRTHLACVRDGTTLTAYQDGVAVGSVAAPGDIAPGTSQVTIGMNSPSGDNLIGTIDEARVWARARTPLEIAAASQRRP